ncbi:peroxide stress protein YaaA [Isachenkonia alkalipeptolytica]|uniref:UPF0246 protein ISALK_05100 n=1 Tax=Isachenkonia alkalipeptolytica TaxID=2565777 RepID=A0AA43XJF1_9CLOT|nr:peroxide stress protein YaaA [Isachenkonia alkalipeptolytica]NBG87872.1 peroxide stress protein YaaA [Isachenkonia alkalipeptolytica]
MRIIISPAKKMTRDTDSLEYRSLPDFLEETEKLLKYLRSISYEELKKLWKCSDKIANENYNRIQNMDLTRQLTPAILAYEGIQYQYMAPGVFDNDELEYLEEHLRILSGFYGILRPFDGVVPYRLEMASKLKAFEAATLYDYWGGKLAKQLFSESDCIVNLASKEYSKSITPYMNDSIRLVNCVFGEREKGKVVEKAARVKMARGEMVRFMAEEKVKDVEALKNFHYLDYRFAEDLSDGENYIFIQNTPLKDQDF